MKREELQQERARLEARLGLLGLRSTGSDRIVSRIREIDAKINPNKQNIFMWPP